MKASITKLVDVILRRIEEYPDGVPTETGLRTWLTRQGYNKRDIDAAMKLIAPRFVQPSVREENRPWVARSLSLFEEYKLTPEARNALARLEFYGLLDPIEREAILDRLNHFDSEIGLDELDYLISWVVCGNRDFESQQTIFGVMDGEGGV
ncbi:MAG TPA: DUF494 family protein, partial [Candidatus Hydrogenedentes bacterium]|nr:DUF494 family protein [Candidatus Hydrogenedentota bacterium]